MCGIIYLEHYLASASKAVLKRYHKQKSRGSDGFGFVAINPLTRKIETIRRRETESDIVKELESSNAQAIMFHHRYPTSTPNLKEASHPITVKNDRLDFVYYVIHNGIISNDDKLKKAHELLGYKYTTEITKTTRYETSKKTYSSEQKMFNDSEALAIELAEYIEGNKDKVEAEGSMAFVVLQADSKGNALNLFYGRNYQNPLKLEQTDAIFSLSSESGKDSVKPQTLFCYNYKTRLITEKPLALDEGYNYDYRGSYTGSYNKDHRQMGFNTLRDDDEIVGAGRAGMTLQEWLETDTILNFSVPDLLAEGWIPDDLVEAIDEEIYLLEEIARDAEFNSKKDECEEAEEYIKYAEAMKVQAQEILEEALA